MQSLHLTISCSGDHSFSNRWNASCTIESVTFTMYSRIIPASLPFSCAGTIYVLFRICFQSSSRNRRSHLIFVQVFWLRSHSFVLLKRKLPNRHPNDRNSPFPNTPLVLSFRLSSECATYLLATIFHSTNHNVALLIQKLSFPLHRPFCRSCFRMMLRIVLQMAHSAHSFQVLRSAILRRVVQVSNRQRPFVCVKRFSRFPALLSACLAYPSNAFLLCHCDSLPVRWIPFFFHRHLLHRPSHKIGLPHSLQNFPPRIRNPHAPQNGLPQLQVGLTASRSFVVFSASQNP